MHFDPRPWYLVAGLAVVSGCIDRPLSSDGGSDDAGSTDDGSTDHSDGDDNPDEGPECVDGDDCPFAHYCIDGTCQQIPDGDGPIYEYDCTSDDECYALQLCRSGYCNEVDTRPPCDIPLPESPALELSEPVLRLAFVDVDADGGAELVVATQTQLHVLESDSPMPTSHPRGAPSETIDAMVGGAFDDMPGDDVILLHDDALDLHASDGLGNLGPAVPSPTPHALTRGVRAGAFDAEPRDDLLVWGTNAAAVIYAGGEVHELAANSFSSASAREVEELGSGFTLLHHRDLMFLDLAGSQYAIEFLRSGESHMQTSFDAMGAPLELGGSTIHASDGLGWTYIQSFDRLTGDLVAGWGLLGAASHMIAGNLDGLDGTDELALIVDETLWLYVGDQCLLPIPFEPVTNVAFGDHDGDGDDELAVHWGGSFVSIVDVE